MGFDIHLSRCTSEKTSVVKDTELRYTLDAVLKETTSLIDPVLLVANNIQALSQCNYVSIPTFHRQYFVNDMVSVRNNLTEIHCHCDVLSTYWEYIKKNSAIIYRQENSNNLYLDDGDFKIYQNPNIIIKTFPDGFRTQSFVLALAGSG